MASRSEMDFAGVFAEWPIRFAGEHDLRPWVALRVQLAGVHHRDAADGGAGAGDQGVGGNEQHHGADEDCGNPGVCGIRGAVYQAGALASVRAEWLAWNFDGRVDRVFYVHWIRFGFNGG